MTAEQLIDVMKGLLTPLIAVITVYIAYQQWRTNQLKLKLERYDRRLRVYEEVTDILRTLLNKPRVDTGDLSQFNKSASEADFLFGPEIPKYIGEIFEHGTSLYRWSAEYRDYTNTQPIPAGYDHAKVVQGMQEEQLWLAKQFEAAKAKFTKYLEISK